ncbi:Uncharacterized membrane protein YesL [Gracilibacillus ureilyticus]|uniref:Uncharacterized membrane protein YesL n=1 Tax=Gracilibacillus ureilyticus TaxID=531814 RepID=A0A1H9UKK1_9BACI|nr:DUF624 domain-containing protein [Gracilibacillus ureilyticus]SES09818.1 Uncharacterized membrane protein YesL [Gracilibacillus ureilyticus]
MSAVKLTELARTFCLSILKLFYLNMLWLLFTMLGLVIFGLAPATAALCQVQHHWLKEKHVSSTFRLFWKEYKQHFMKTNGLMIILISIGYIIYFDLQFFMDKEGLWNRLISIGIFILSIWYMIIILYIFPVYTYYEVKLFKYIQYAFIVGLLNPFRTIGVAFTVGGMVYLSLYFPQIMFSLGVSLTFFILMIMANQAMNQVAVKKERYS